MSQVVIGTAGHIDHGKTALVKALTGTNTDRLAEEQARGMTIDLGFAFLTDDITIIDVPGHEKFIRNMVSGVSTISIALLVIAADDGVMPQTREHLQILSLLQIPLGVIALTKIDLAEPEWIELVEDDIRQLCKDTFLENAPVVKTSIANGNGIEDLRNLLLEKSEQVQSKSDRGYFRLQVDRSFTKTGFGSVVTGTVISGELNKGDEVQILPSEKIGRVRGLQSHGKSVEVVKLGDRAAVNITGLDKKDLWRGAELVSNGWIKSTIKIIANIRLISDSKWQIKSKQRVRIHLGTQELLARVIIPKSTLRAGETTNIIVQFEESAVVAMDDRFVIRSYSPMETIGGGMVLDTNPKGTVKSIKLWAKELAVEQENRLLQFINRDMKNPKTFAEWSKIFHVSPQYLKSMISDIKLRTTNGKPLIYSDENIEKCQGMILNILTEFHKSQPYQKAMSGEELREKSNFSNAWFEFVLSSLIFNENVKQIQSGYALSSYSLELSNSDQKIADMINNYISDTNFEPVSIENISTEIEHSIKKTLEIIHVQKSQNKLVNITDKLWASRAKINEMIDMIKQHFEANKTLSVGQFKEYTGLTRKSIIPLLEYFDSQNITERDGNDRLKGSAL